MTKLEYIETKRKGMICLYEQLQQYYEKNNNSFANLTLDSLASMIRELDNDSFVKDGSRGMYYESCYYCNKIKPYEDEKENKTMDNRVAKFLTEIMNGTEPNTAIENSGVGEMDLRDVLVEIAGVWNANLLELLLNHPKWNEVSDKIADYQKLRDAINTIKEMDEALDSLREDVTENNE